MNFMSWQIRPGFNENGSKINRSLITTCARQRDPCDREWGKGSIVSGTGKNVLNKKMLDGN
jgi:hypothetical protein